MSRGVSEKTKKLTLSAVLAAMGVVLLMIGSFEVLDLSMAALASFFCVFAVIEMGGGYPWMIYTITGILAVIPRPANLAAWFYILFFGYYPIVKEKLERLFKPLAWVLKLVVFNSAVTFYALICYFLFFSELKGLLDEFSSIFGGMQVGVLLLASLLFTLNNSDF